MDSYKSNRIALVSLPAVDLFVLLRVLVVVVGAESELSPADAAPEAAAVEEGEVFQGPDLVRRINRLFAPETYVLHVRALPAPKHCGAFLNGVSLSIHYQVQVGRIKPGLVTDSILFCWLFTIEDPFEKCVLLQTHNQGF